MSICCDRASFVESFSHPDDASGSGSWRDAETEFFKSLPDRNVGQMQREVYIVRVLFHLIMRRHLIPLSQSSTETVSSSQASTNTSIPRTVHMSQILSSEFEVSLSPASRHRVRQQQLSPLRISQLQLPSFNWEDELDEDEYDVAAEEGELAEDEDELAEDEDEVDEEGDEVDEEEDEVDEEDDEVDEEEDEFDEEEDEDEAVQPTSAPVVSGVKRRAMSPDDEDTESDTTRAHAGQRGVRVKAQVPRSDQFSRLQAYLDPPVNPASPKTVVCGINGCGVVLSLGNISSAMQHVGKHIVDKSNKKAYKCGRTGCTHDDKMKWTPYSRHYYKVHLGLEFKCPGCRKTGDRTETFWRRHKKHVSCSITLG